GLTYRKAIYTPMAETLPSAFVIDIDSCLNTPPNYLPCQRCVEVCEDDAIHFDVPLTTMHQRQVGALILAPGFKIADSVGFSELGYGKHPDIVTSAELQRLLESPGPTGGYASKPSNEEYPDSALLVVENPSPFGLYIVASQAHQLLEQGVGSIAVLVMAPPSGDNAGAEVGALANQAGVQLSWGAMLKVDPAPDDTLAVSYEDLSTHRYVKGSFDMVVLCSDVAPADRLAELSKTAAVEMTASGYLALNGEDSAGVGTCRPGVFAAGCASGPKNIRDSIATAHAAATGALLQLDPRLLRPDYETRKQEAPGASAPALSEVEARARIEKMLYALLGKADA
ncbi:MAG: FAD-dependent oxidoreductase, partial [Gammaproteobacteria bacterium]|nr:FAD-dependent oxidoreductase [Gammaproteobacteria bacterium]